MPYSRDSHLKDKTLRHMAAFACLTEIAIAVGGEWNSSRLEEKLFGRKYNEQSGIFRRMSRGVVPNDTTVLRIENAIHSKFGFTECDIAKWRDHPIWQLLRREPISQKAIEAAYESVEDNIQKCFWTTETPYDPRGPFYRRPELSENCFNDIASYANSDALVALIAIARETRDHGLYTMSLRASFEAKDLLPYVISKTPHLYVCWKALASRLQELYWDTTAGEATHPEDELDVEEMENEIEELMRSSSQEGIIFPPRTILEHFNRTLP